MPACRKHSLVNSVWTLMKTVSVPMSSYHKEGFTKREKARMNLLVTLTLCWTKPHQTSQPKWGTRNWSFTLWMFFLIKHCCDLNYIANTNTCSDNLESYRTTLTYAHADKAETSIQKITKDESWIQLYTKFQKMSTLKNTIKGCFITAWNLRHTNGVLFCSQESTVRPCPALQKWLRVHHSSTWGHAINMGDTALMKVSPCLIPFHYSKWCP